MSDEKLKHQIIEQYLSQALARRKLGEIMGDAIRQRLYPTHVCPKCGKDISGVMDPILHTDEACCIWLVMES